MARRLAASTSPYLQQHADNPVDWWEWGEDAFAEARRRDVPVLLSVGYSACHWCHVMAHESFEDEGVAAVVNAGFVPVKVDREERPDVDAVYITATTALTGHGGWPMTCLLTPDGAPFWAGTYLPREQLLTLLDRAGAAWGEDRDGVVVSAGRIVEALRRGDSGQTRSAAADAAGGDSLGEEDLEAAVTLLASDFDRHRGGFGAAPKFPPSMVLAFLLRHVGRTGDERALEMVRRTCSAMARSGLYDQLGGGFARYAVDRDWVVPHFEKMLYDNALLLGVYADLWRVDPASRPLAERVVRETVEWLLQDLWTSEAAFASALDADTDGQEGLTYVWTPAQLEAALGRGDGRRAASVLGVTGSGTFEHGTSTLQLRTDPGDRVWWAGVRERLLLHRTLRPQPHRDDKVVTAWNGLLVASLAHAGWLLEEPDWVDVAERCARFLLDVHVVGGRLRRSSRDGVVGAALGVAEDYGNLVDGLLALHRATGKAEWLVPAGELADAATELFADGAGGFSATGHDAEALVLDPTSTGDNAEPSGTSALVVALARHGALAGRADHLEAARRGLASTAALARSAPRFAGWALVAAEELAAGPTTVRLSPRPAPPPEPRHVKVGWPLEAAARHTPPSVLVVVDDPTLEPLDGRQVALTCRGTVCGLPSTDAEEMGRGL